MIAGMNVERFYTHAVLARLGLAQVKTAQGSAPGPTGRPLPKPQPQPQPRPQPQLPQATNLQGAQSPQAATPQGTQPPQAATPQGTRPPQAANAQTAQSPQTAGAQAASAQQAAGAQAQSQQPAYRQIAYSNEGIAYDASQLAGTRNVTGALSQTFGLNTATAYGKLREARMRGYAYIEGGPGKEDQAGYLVWRGGNNFMLLREIGENEDIGTNIKDVTEKVRPYQQMRQGSPWGSPQQQQYGWGYPQPGWGYPQPGWGYPQPGWGYPQPGWGYPQPGWGYPQPGWGYPQRYGWM